MAQNTDTDQDPITIKKYANRRLYNTATSTYVTLEDLCEMVKKGNDFLVYDAKSGDDITRSVLTQIIFEEESKGQNLLPIRFLRQLIGFYGDSHAGPCAELSGNEPGNPDAGAGKVPQAHDRYAFGGEPFKAMEQQAKQNMAMFEQAMSMFVPFGAQRRPQPVADQDEPPRERGKVGRFRSDARSQLRAMQKQLDDLAKKS